MRRVATELPDGGVWERGWTLPQRVGHFRFGLDRLRALADEHGFGVVVLIVPHLVGQPGEPPPPRLEQHAVVATLTYIDAA